MNRTSVALPSEEATWRTPTCGSSQAVYWEPGHAPLALEDTEYVDFSPTGDVTAVVDHLRAQGG